MLFSKMIVFVSYPGKKDRPPYALISVINDINDIKNC
jgi:hypothetical protein